MARKRHFFGWIGPEPRDDRDVLYSFSPLVAKERPPLLNLREFWKTPPLNQLQLGRCGPMSAKSEAAFDQEQDPLPDLELCSLFVYWNTRHQMGIDEGNPSKYLNQDSGVYIRSMFKALAKWGWCTPDKHTEDILRFREKPSDAAYADGAKRKLLRYERVPNTAEAVESAIASRDPFVFGVPLYASYVRAERTGDLPNPRRGESPVGGHAMALCGYNQNERFVDFRNSWGEGWGNGGYGRMSYEYLLEKGSDFWTGRYVVEPAPPVPPDPGPAPVPPAPGPSMYCRVWGAIREVAKSRIESVPAGIYRDWLRATAAAMDHSCSFAVGHPALPRLPDAEAAEFLAVCLELSKRTNG